MAIGWWRIGGCDNPLGVLRTGCDLVSWATALLVVWVGTLGLLHDSWPRRTQAYWINVHALCGLVVWAIVVVRFWWRNRHPGPDLPPGVGEFSRRLSKPVHLLLCALPLVTPIVGIVTFIWHGGGSSTSGVFRHQSRRSLEPSNLSSH